VTIVMHQPRVAWDAARAFVAAAGGGDDEYAWLAAHLQTLLGPAYRLALRNTRIQLLRWERPDIAAVESGLWRVRLTDLLGTHPDLVEDVQLLARQTAARQRPQW